MMNSIASAMRNLREGLLIAWDPGGRAIIQSGFWVRPGRTYVFRIRSLTCEIDVCGFVKYSHMLSGLLRRFEIGLEIGDFLPNGGRRFTDLELSTPGAIRVIGRPRLVGVNWAGQPGWRPNPDAAKSAGATARVQA